jgi:hypothetical protein
VLGLGDGDEHLRALLADWPDTVLATGDAVLRSRLPAGRALTPKAFAAALAL